MFDLRILYVVHQFFPKWYTGTERFVLNLAKQMQKMGHYVEVVTYGLGDDNGFSANDDISIKKSNFENVPVTYLKYTVSDENLNFNIFNNKSNNLELFFKKYLENGRFNLVHVGHPMRLGFGIKAASSLNLPIVLTLTDFWPMCPRGIAVTGRGELCNNPRNGEECVEKCFGDLWKDKLINRFEDAKELFLLVNSIVSPTDFLGKMYKNAFPFINLMVVHYADDYKNIRFNSRRYSKDSELTLGFLSTLLPHKGAHVLLEAFNISETKNIRLKIYGHYFTEKDYYECLVKKYNSKNIEFCGEYKYEDLSNILHELDMIVVPSVWWENSPLVMLQALAHNVPAIVSDLGGMTEVIKDGVNGFTFKIGNAESLAKKLKLLSNDPTILNELKAGIRHPPRIEESAFEYEKLYLRLVSRQISSVG